MQDVAPAADKPLNTQKYALWCNLIFVAMTAIGWLAIANFIMPAEANLGFEGTHEWFTEDHRWGVLVGCTIFYIAAGLLAPGSIQFGIMLSKIEGRYPVLSYTTAVCGTFIALIIFFNCCGWMVAAYREDASPEIAQTWNDWAWFAFLLGWFWLTVEMVASGIVELMDRRERPMIPRWLTWYTFAGAATLVFAAGPAFTKSGPFAYHGLLAFYVPVAIWGFYLTATTWFMLKELDREQAAEAAAAAENAAAAGTPRVPVA